MTADLWNRAVDGKHTAVVGPMEVGAMPAELLLLEVDCDLGDAPLEPLVALCQRVEALLGDFVAGEDSMANPLLWGGLRRRILGDSAEPMHAGRLVGTLNRLAAALDRPAAVWLHAIDRADPATRELVVGALAQEGWLRVPLILGVEEPDSDVVGQLRELLGDDAMLGGDGGEQSFDAGDLPDEVARVLRAAVVVGDVFDVDDVAELLCDDPVDVLEALQVAHDRGLPLRDRGRGIFSLPVPVAEAIRGSMLPSLRRAWHDRLADLLGAPVDDDRAAEPAGEAELADPYTPVMPTMATGPSLRSLGDLIGEGSGATAPPPGEFEEALDRAAREPSVEPQVPEMSPVRDPARAARHAAEAGRLEEAVWHTLAVAGQTAELGAFDQAMVLVDRAADAVERMPRTEVADALRARVELERGRIAWTGVGTTDDRTLAEAIGYLERALPLAEASGETLLVAEVLATAAAVRFDVGDRDSLETALAELTRASLDLARSGRPMEAARLLNDQAAIWTRLGDPVRAYHLLAKSQEVFARVDSPIGRLERAETDHQTARLVLHAPARSGRERDAIEVGLEHAERAAAAFAELQLPHELARVKETMGRLALRGGQGEAARDHLSQAFSLQRRHGDGVGLAKTTAALAELYARSGDVDRALEALADSVELNIGKGSPLGLAFNLETLDRIAETGEAGGAEELRTRIEEAQAVVGVVDNPGELLGPAD
jgi:tetratricopeptide (TPR) repeat protein